MKHLFHRRLLPLIGFAVAAIGLRLWALFALADDPRIKEPPLDAAYYLDLARRLSEGVPWPQEPFFMAPLYPWLLAGLFKIAPPYVLTVQIAQSLLGLGSLIFLAAATRRWLGPFTAWCASFLFIFCGPVLAIENAVLSESFLLFLTTAVIYFWPDSSQSRIRTFLFGLACGLLSAGRASFLLLPLAAIVSLKPWRQFKTSTLPLMIPLILFGTVLPLTPQLIHQTRTCGHIQLLTMNGGMNLYIGNNHLARGIFSSPPEMDLNDDFTCRNSASILTGRELSLEESSKFWRDRTLADIRSDPGHALILIGKKIIKFFSPREIPQIYNFQILAERHLPLQIAFIRFSSLLPLALAGLLMLRQKRIRPFPNITFRELLPWLIPVAIAWLQIVMFFATGRYRIVILPAFLGLAGLGLAGLINLIRARSYLLPSLTIAGFILMLICPAGYPEIKARAYDAYYQGLRLTNDKQYEDALAEYRRSTGIYPANGEAWHGVGTALSNLNRYSEAIEAYRRALQIIPRSAITHYALGLAYYRLNEISQANNAFAETTALNPRHGEYHFVFGVTLAQLGRTDEAARQWRMTLQSNPGHQQARQYLRELEESRAGD